MAPVSRERWMALFFALGSLCFLVGPFPGYANLVGDKADAITFFVGSILFTAGGALQSLLAFPERRRPPAGPRGGRRSSSRPARCSSTSRPTGDAHGADEPRVQQARVASRRVRVGLLPGLRRDRVPRLAAPRLAAGARGAGAGGSRRSTCSAASSSGSRRSPATWCRRRARYSISPPPTGTRRWAPPASSACAWRRCSAAAPPSPRRLRRLRELEHRVEREVEHVESRI